MLRLVGLWQEFQQAASRCERLGDLMNAPPEPYAVVPSARTAAQRRRSRSHGRLLSAIREHLPFCISNLTLAIEPGSLIVLMGPSGCGKSTLAKLLLGFYPPSDGRDPDRRRDIAPPAGNELRQHFGVVPQETTLFSGTIYDNLLDGQPARELRARGRGLQDGRDPRRRSSSCRRATRPRSASTASACPAARSSASRSPAHC